jgi:acetyl esterase/lipase
MRRPPACPGSARAWLLLFALVGLLPLSGWPAGADPESKVELRDGRVYAGGLTKKGKRTRIDGAKRWIDVPSERVGGAEPRPVEGGADPKPWEDRFQKLAAAAALAKDEASARLCASERAALTPRVAERLARAFAAGASAPIPAQPEDLSAELLRARAARVYGPWLSTEALRGLDLEQLARAEGLLATLLGKAPQSPESESTLDAIDEVGLPYATWEALVRGGAGLPSALPPAPKGPIPLELEGGTKSRYLLHVPKGLEPGVSAPVIVALHGQGDSLGLMIRCWSRFADAEGALLISVEYAVTGQEGYHHSYLEQSATLAALRDLSRSYRVDMSRVFVTGHSMGGHAAWDVAFSHPDRFAGVIPLISSHFAFDTHYRRNSRQVPVYCIQGEKDVWTERCREQTADMIKLGADVTYVEYKGRGHEGFYEEQPWIAPWFRARQRDPYPQRFELVAGRTTDFRRFWVELEELRIRLFDLAPTDKVPKRHVATVKAKVEKGNTLRVDCKEATALRVLLSDRLLDLDKKVRLRVNRKVRFKGRVERSLRFMLRDFLARGDREALYATAVELEGL